MDPTELPEYWQTARRTENDLCTGTYQHAHLDVEIQIVSVEVDGQNKFDIYLNWSSLHGAVEGVFELDDEINADEEAKNWAIALMQQIDHQYQPGRSNYVSRAMDFVRGDDPEPARTGTGSIGTRCPVCNGPFEQFRGFDPYEQAENHFEYMDDVGHRNTEISIQE